MTTHLGSRGDRRPRLTSRWLAQLTMLPLIAISACDREARDFRQSPPSASPSSVVRVGTLQPGPVTVTSERRAAQEDNAYALTEGMRLYNWFNCAGCHAKGGGGMGPALMDDLWIYGSAPENIYDTIVEGRPNGMPSFGGRIPPQQLWQLVAYVRSLSALNSYTARSSRDDHMMALPQSSILQKRERPKQGGARPNTKGR